MLHTSSYNETKLELNNVFLMWLMPPLHPFFSFASCSPGDVSISCVTHFFEFCGLNVT